MPWTKVGFFIPIFWGQSIVGWPSKFSQIIRQNGRQSTRIISLGSSELHGTTSSTCKNHKLICIIQSSPHFHSSVKHGNIARTAGQLLPAALKPSFSPTTWLCSQHLAQVGWWSWRSETSGVAYLSPHICMYSHWYIYIYIHIYIYTVYI